MIIDRYKTFFWENLNHTLQRKQMNLSQLSNDVFFNKSSLQKCRDKNKTPDFPSIIKIAQSLHITVEELFTPLIHQTSILEIPYEDIQYKTSYFWTIQNICRYLDRIPSKQKIILTQCNLNKATINSKLPSEKVHGKLVSDLLDACAKHLSYQHFKGICDYQFSHCKAPQLKSKVFRNMLDVCEYMIEEGQSEFETNHHYSFKRVGHNEIALTASPNESYDNSMNSHSKISLAQSRFTWEVWSHFFTFIRGSKANDFSFKHVNHHQKRQSTLYIKQLAFH